MMNLTALNNEQMMRSAPSIFAANAHERVSDRYSFLPTIEVVEGMRKNGWLPVSVNEQRVRDESRKGFQKHMIRFRQASDLTRMLRKEDTLVEVLLTNSHDRSSAYQLHAGVFRLICGNGLVVCDATFAKISIKHSGFKPDSVIDGSFKVLDEVPTVTNEIEMMRSKTLSDSQRSAFAEAALIAKYGEVEAAPVMPDKVLTPRRIDDRKADVWSTFNVIQENLVRGGQRDLRKRKEDGSFFKRTREVKGIDENVKLNKALWHLAKTIAIAV
jgi:hypothetical protein